jgi:hypothetical protein
MLKTIPKEFLSDWGAPLSDDVCVLFAYYYNDNDEKV